MNAIYVTGNAARQVPYDIMSIRITFQNNSEDTSEAVTKTFEQCEKFLHKIEEIGISPDKITLSGDDTTEDRSMEKTIASRTIIYSAPLDVTAMNCIIAILANHKFNAHYNVSYSCSQLKNIKEELVAEAFANSKMKAEIIAHASGSASVRLEKVKFDSDFGSDFDEEWDEDWDEDEINHKVYYRYGDCSNNFDYSNRLQTSGKVIEESVNAVWVIE